MAETKTATDSGTYQLSEVPVGGTTHTIFLDFVDPVTMERLDVSFILANVERTTEFTVAFSFDDVNYNTASTVHLNNQFPQQVNIMLGESLGSQTGVYVKISCNHESNSAIAGICDLSGFKAISRESITGLISLSTGAKHDIGTPTDSMTRGKHQIGEPIDVNFLYPIANAVAIETLITSLHGIPNPIDFCSAIKWDDFTHMETVTGSSHAVLPIVDVSDRTRYLNDFEKLESSTKFDYRGILPKRDFISSGGWISVDRFYEKPIKPKDYRYQPTTDFNITDNFIGFTSDFTKPLDFESLHTKMSPVGLPTSYKHSRPDEVDLNKEINWGYSVNAFLVGGSTNSVYPVDPEALQPVSTIEHTEYEVLRVVNVVNMVVLPARTPIDFTNLQMSIDLESFAWSCTFEVSNETSFNLIRPTGSTTKEIEVDVNGQKWVFFVAKTNTSLNNSKRVFKVVAWSKSKKLSYPYSPKRSHNETTNLTAAQIASNEVLGTGFSINWQAIDWTIPANVFGYIDKSPIAALSELCQSIGAVIQPDLANNELTVKPYYKVNPWAWNTEIPDRTMFESQFFTIDTAWIPQENPETIYVSGEETGGVLCKCTKQGTAGLVELPMVVDKHITQTTAGAERGRQELCKHSHKEIVPVSTYVDMNGVVMPSELIEVTELDGATKWRGMVISTTVTMQRNGNALIQQLNIVRHYDN